MERLAVLFFSALFVTASPVIGEHVQPDDFDKLNADAEVKFIVEYSNGNVMNIGYGCTKPYAGTPEEAAVRFLKQYHRIFSISSDIHEVRFARGGDAPGHTSHMIYQQYYKGLPVFSSQINVVLDAQNRVIRTISSIKNIGDFNVAPAIHPDRLQHVLHEKNPEYGPIETMLGLRIEFYDGRPVLAYHLSTSTGEDHDKKKALLSVDANTGEILKSTEGIVKSQP